MAPRRAILRQAVLTSYAKAMQNAGIKEWRVVARPDGSHEIVAGATDAAATGPDPDELLR